MDQHSTAFGVEHLGCVDCGGEKLESRGEALVCAACGRSYQIVDGIYCMLPKELEEKKKDEIAARDEHGVTYDQERASDYTRQLDYYGVEIHDIGPDDMVLDIACGTGRTTIKLAREAAHVVGVDFSLESLKVAKQKAEDEGLSNITFIQADADNLPMRVKDFFSFTCAGDFFQHILTFSLRERLLGRLFEYTAPGGGLAITTYHHGVHKQKGHPITGVSEPGEFGKQGVHVTGIQYYNYQLEELYALTAQAGFRVVDYRLFYFVFPRPVRILRRLLGLDRMTVERLTYPFLSRYADRVYIHAVK